MSFTAWAIVEIMGHQIIAGKVSEETHFGAPLMRVDVPKSSKREGFTCYYGGNAIYKITPTTEDIVQAFVEKQDPEPIKPYMLALPTMAAHVTDNAIYSRNPDGGFTSHPVPADDYDPDELDDWGADEDDEFVDDSADDPWDEYDRRKDDMQPLSDDEVDEMLDEVEHRDEAEPPVEAEQKNNEPAGGES